MMLPNSGASTTAINRLLERVISIFGSALQRIDFAHVDGAASTEQSPQDREPDCSFGCGHGQDEEYAQLACGIAEFARKGEAVDVHRQQHHLDRHQQYNYVLSLQ